MPDQKELIVNPLINQLAKTTIKALIIKVNKPKVRILTGKVKIIITGLIKIFNNPKTITAVTAVIKLSITTPGIR